TQEGVDAVRALGADGYIAQAEDEGQYEAALAVGDQVGVPKGMVGNSTMFKNADGGVRQFPAGWAAMPEVYENTNPNAAGANAGLEARRSGAEVVIPIVGAYDGTSEGGHKFPLEGYLHELDGEGYDGSFGAFSIEAMSPEDRATWKSWSGPAPQAPS